MMYWGHDRETREARIEEWRTLLNAPLISSEQTTSFFASSQFFRRIRSRLARKEVLERPGMYACWNNSIDGRVWKMRRSRRAIS